MPNIHFDQMQKTYRSLKKQVSWIITISYQSVNYFQAVTWLKDLGLWLDMNGGYCQIIIGLYRQIFQTENDVISWTNQKSILLANILTFGNLKASQHIQRIPWPYKNYSWVQMDSSNWYF